MADVTLEPTGRPPDGVECSEEADWGAARSGAGESFETGYVAGIERREGTPNTWYGWRSVMFFDLSTVSAYTLTPVVLTLKPTSSFVGLNGDLVCVQATSVTYDDLALADYADLLGETTEYGRITEADWNAAYTISGTVDLTINAAGLAYLRTRAGSTLVLGFRSSYDIDGTTQTGDCKPFIWSVVTLPSLAVTYTADWPTDAITRATSLTHRYNRATGEYNLEIGLGEVDADFAMPSVKLVAPSASPKKEEEKYVTTYRPDLLPYAPYVPGIERRRPPAEEPAPPTTLPFITAPVVPSGVKGMEEFMKLLPKPSTESTARHVITPQPGTQERLGEMQEERKKWWEFWK